MVVAIVAVVAAAFFAGVLVGGIIVNRDVIDDSEEPIGRWVLNEFTNLFGAKI